MTVSKVRPSSPRLSALATSNRTVSPRSPALRRARSMARGETSTPTASAPRAAASSACSPLPQPASSTRPDSRPPSARRTNAGCGRPMSHGGREPASYAESQRAAGVVMMPPLLDGRGCCPCITGPAACSLSTEADTQRSGSRRYPDGRHAAGGAAVRRPAGEGTHGGSMDTAVGRDRFWEMFKGRAVMVSELPAGPSRALANVASELAGRDGASLRTRAEYEAFFDVLLAHVPPAPE